MAKICCGGFELGEGLELDGKTLKATGGAGGEMVVNVNLNMEDFTVTADKTIAEIYEAAKAGTKVVAKMIMSATVEIIYFWPLVSVSSTFAGFGTVWDGTENSNMIKGINNTGTDVWEIYSE